MLTTTKATPSLASQTRRLIRELALEAAPALRSALRELIAAQGYEAALAQARRALAQTKASAVARQQACLHLILSGVTIVDPATTYVEPKVSIGPETVVYPNTTISGRTRIGRRCHIGPNSIVINSEVGNDCRLVASMVEGAVLEDGVDVGPFSHLRPGTRLESGVHVGNFVEVKKSCLGRGTKAGHFSYIGDAQVGANVNIGAGTVTCNFDGVKKHKTIIEEGAFIGSDTMLVAPLTVGAGASTGAGSVVTKDVPPGALVAGVPARRSARRRRPARPGGTLEQR